MEHDCHVEPIQKVASADEQEQIELVLLAVWGMGCPNCANRVRNSVLSIYGVTATYVDHAAGIAQISYNPNFVKIDSLISAIRWAGRGSKYAYGARLLATVLPIIVEGTGGGSQHDGDTRRFVTTLGSQETSNCKS